MVQYSNLFSYISVNSFLPQNQTIFLAVRICVHMLVRVKAGTPMLKRIIKLYLFLGTPQQVF